MADRPLGTSPVYQRDFDICGEQSFTSKVKKRWYHLKTYSFGRGSILDFELDDELVEWLFNQGWVYKRKDEYFFSEKGTKEFTEFIRREIARD